jgi:hypothetical protein
VAFTERLPQIVDEVAGPGKSRVSGAEIAWWARPPAPALENRGKEKAPACDRSLVLPLAKMGSGPAALTLISRHARYFNRTHRSLGSLKENFILD